CQETLSYKAYSLKVLDQKLKERIFLPYGEYAVQVFHDENSNTKLDKRIFGIPIERYGFSNNASGKFGPPEYEEVSFTVDSFQTKMEISLK
ncbi:MAG: DUF2141 domain-containing protein, partial [Desulfobacteraceae bacterium]|nr:DUF2141 domain-containing protein [Desulfobacteraceae bacterium]